MSHLYLNKYHHLHFLSVFMALRQEYVPESILKIEGPMWSEVLGGKIKSATGERVRNGMRDTVSKAHACSPWERGWILSGG